MQYSLDIKEHNKQAHIDIERDIKLKDNGLFTFTLRVNNANIVDYNVTEYVDARKYLALKRIVITEFTVAHDNHSGSKGNSIRTDNI